MTAHVRGSALAPALPRTAADITLRAGVAATLAVDAVVHWRLAEDYGLAFPGGVGGDTVFRVEAVLAVLVALYLLYRDSRPAWGAALAVLASAFVAVVLYRYVQVPQLGPIPSMYEPVWFTEKTVSALAEGAGALLAAAGLARVRHGRRGRRAARG